MFPRLLCASLAALGLVTATGPALAQAPAPAPAAPLSIEDIWKQPQLSNIRLSRDGKYMAATAPVRGRMNLVVIELATRNALAVTGYTDFDVISVNWVGNDRLLYSLGQFNTPTGPGRFDGGGLFMVSRDGKESRRISPTVRETRGQGQNVYRGYSFFRSIPGTDEEVIASGNMADAESSDLYRLNILTGRASILTTGRPSEYAQSWIMDGKLVPRVMTAGVKDTLTQVIWYRKDANAPWQEIARFDAAKGPALVPLAFESDDKTLQVAYNGDRDTMAVFRYDPDAKKFGELIAQHPKYDMGADQQGARVLGVTVDPETNRILGYQVQAAKPEVVWLDPKYAALQAMLDRHMPGRINRFSRTPDGKLVEQRPFTFKTRDGLEIPGYYFLPKDWKPGTKLPTLVHIHGGPPVRADTFGSGFGYNEGQLFASRGYAVIVPNFRITPGLGSKIYYGGFGTFGRQMSDDHEDALKWGIEQGFVDPARACMTGASYGGYAPLQAIVRNPGMWKCAIAGLAVTDLKFQLTSFDGDTPTSAAAVSLWKSILGTGDFSSPIVREISPLFFADKMKGKPIFLYAGLDDIRVPIAQIKEMAGNLESAGNPAKAFVVKRDEGHGFGKLENNVDLYNQIFDFLKKNL